MAWFWNHKNASVYLYLYGYRYIYIYLYIYVYIQRPNKQIALFFTYSLAIPEGRNAREFFLRPYLYFWRVWRVRPLCTTDVFGGVWRVRPVCFISFEHVIVLVTISSSSTSGLSSNISVFTVSCDGPKY